MHRGVARQVVAGAFLALTPLGLAAAPARPQPVAASQGAAAPDPPGLRLSHDLTFRPTVVVRKGNAQGSGTVIASVDGETLVLTAAHVARAEEKGPILVELHRYNLGVEGALSGKGWPLRLEAELVAADAVGDVAVLRVAGRRALPFVAKLAPVGEEPGAGDPVLSVGIDGGESLNSWASRVRATVWFAMDQDQDGGPALVAMRGDRPFLLTDRPPEHGRSGGGLYSRSGALAGVCVGRVGLGRRGKEKGAVQGLFASAATVRQLLREHDLEASVARSEVRETRRPAVTPTRARPRTP